jgi:mRNA degradation ribonuclease J1/J2
MAEVKISLIIMNQQDFFGELEEEIGFWAPHSSEAPSTPQHQPSNEGKRPRNHSNRTIHQQKEAPSGTKPKVHVPQHKQLERSLMSHAGVIVVVLPVSQETREVLRDPHLETRGFSYSKEQAPVIAGILDTMKRSYTQTIQDLPELEGKEVTKIIRWDIERTIESLTHCKPVVIPVILSL